MANFNGTGGRPKLRVLHVITGLNDGGAEAVLTRLVGAATSCTHCVVSLMDAGKYGPLLREQGIDVFTLNMPRGKLRFWGLIALVRLVWSWRPNVMQTWMYHADLIGGLVGRCMKVPVVWGVHNTVLEPGRSARSTIWVATLCAWLSRLVPVRIVACAQSAAAVHQQLGYDGSRMVVIPNGYDLSRFEPDEGARQRLRQEWSVPDGVPLIGMVARFDPYKDHANLLEALRLLRDQGQNFRVVLIGVGMDPSNTELVEWISKAGFQDVVNLLGPRSDIPAVMNALDLHVLSSSAEAFPNVLAEAMACGTPCVTTDVGDARWIVGTAGWVVPKSDPVALSQGCFSALNAGEDHKYWEKMRIACRLHIQNNFGIDHVAHKYASAWRQAAQLA